MSTQTLRQRVDTIAEPRRVVTRRNDPQGVLGSRKFDFPDRRGRALLLSLVPRDARGIATSCAAVEVVAARSSSIAVANGNFTTLRGRGRLRRYRLLRTRSTSGQQLTVFAPTDAAFLASPFGPLTAGNICTVPQGVLTDILLYHVETGRHFSNSVLPKKAGQTRTIDTLLGQSFKVGATGAIATTGGLTTPRIVAANIAATNGVIHGRRRVLVSVALIRRPRTR